MDRKEVIKRLKEQRRLIRVRTERDYKFFLERYNHIKSALEKSDNADDVVYLVKVLIELEEIKAKFYFIK